MPRTRLQWRIANDEDRCQLVFEDPDTGIRVVAEAWHNGVWQTWGHDGTGGEHGREGTLVKAKAKAALRAILQGFI